MDMIDLTSAIGIAALVGAIIVPIKKIYKNKFKLTQKWFGVMTVSTTLVLSTLVSYIAFGADMIDNDTSLNALIRGLQSTFIAIGGYEGVKQLLELLVPKKES